MVLQMTLQQKQNITRNWAMSKKKPRVSFEHKVQYALNRFIETAELEGNSRMSRLSEEMFKIYMSAKMYGDEE